MERQVTCRLLGDFTITVDGVEVGADGFTRRSGADLVRLLALAPRRRRHREQVCDALWPDVDVDVAVRRLHKAASYARRALGTPDAVVLRDLQVALFPDREVVTDVEVVEGAAVDDPRSVQAAIDAYRGDLLPDAAYAEWALEPRDRLRGRYLELLRVAGRWRTLVEVDPANEEAHVALMAQSVELGDHHEALRRYDELERVLDAELGVPPGPDASAVRDAAVESLAAPAAPAATGLRAFVVAALDRGSAEAGPARDEDLHRRLADAIEQTGGTVFSRPGQLLSAAFNSAVDAVAGAVACVHAAQPGAADGIARTPGLRVGVDAGEARRRGRSWTGPAVRRATALSEAASGSQILCSSLVAELAGPDMPDGVDATALGVFRLPDLPPLAVHQVRAAGVDRRRARLTASRVAGRPVAAPLTPTVGRSRELEIVGDRLHNARLVTIVGPGGAGKTHLAAEVALARADDYHGGAWCCELGTVSDGSGAEAGLLAAVGGTRHTDTTVRESIVRTLGERRTLVVLDNCEHLLDPVTAMCAEILARCPSTRVLATSREPLGLPGEMVVVLGELDRAAAVELFCREAERHGAGVDPADPALDRLCARLDDLPLALRLAAARTRALGLADIEALLDDRFDALRSAERAGPDHHRTLRAAIAWSVDALDLGPLGVLTDLSVLANRFSLDAAVAVACRPDMRRGEALDHFDELVRRSLVSSHRGADDQPSHRLLESVRLYARGMASDGGAADRHLAYVVARVEGFDAMMRDDPDQALRGIQAEWDDIRLAHGHAMAVGAVEESTRLLASVAVYALARLEFEYLHWCEEALSPASQPVRDAPHARALGGWACMMGMRGDYTAALELARRALEHEPDDDVALYAAGWNLGWLTDDFDEMRIPFERLIEDRSGRAGTLRAAALTVLTSAATRTRRPRETYLREAELLATNPGSQYQLNHRAVTGHDLLFSDTAGALDALQDAISLGEKHDLVLGAMAARNAYSFVVSRMGTIPEALKASRQNLAWFRDHGAWSLAMLEVPTVVRILQRAGQPDVATMVLSASKQDEYGRGFAGGGGKLRAGLRDGRDDEYDRAWAAGRDLDVPSAVALAITTIDAVLDDAAAAEPGRRTSRLGWVGESTNP